MPASMSKYKTELDEMAALQQRVVELEAELHKTRQNHQDLIDVVDSIGDAFFAVDQRWRLRFVNKDAAQFAGMSQEALLAMTFWEAFPQLVGTSYETEFRQAMDERKPVHFERRGILADGWWHTTVCPTEQGLSIYRRDITARKQAEEALRLSEERIRSMVEVMPVAMYTCDSEGLITYYNQRAAELWGQHPVLGDPDSKFCGAFRLYYLDGTLLSHDQTPMAMAVRTGKMTRNEEIVIERPDGSTLYVSVNIVPLYDQTGRRTGAINVFADITQRKQAELEREQLMADLMQEQEKLKQLTETLEVRVQERAQQVKQLAAQLSLAEHRERDRISQILHDHVQQMLYGVQWRLHLLELQSSDGRSAEASTPVADMKQLTEEAIRTVRTLSVELSPPVLANEGLPEALSWLANQMKELYSLNVVIHTHGDCQVTDRNLRIVLFQIVRELLFNVVKHAQINQASVKLHQEDAHFVAIVEDAGKGFDVAVAFNGNHPHTGLGMASIRERLELLDGHLEVHSAPGQGTQVKLILPVWDRNDGSVAGRKTAGLSQAWEAD